MALKTYRVAKISSVRQSERRGLAYLICPEDGEIDACKTLEGLEESTDAARTKRRQHLYSSFELWRDFGRNDNRFHGWPNEPSHKNCIVFKWSERGQLQRMYGFTCHPLKTVSNFQLCVLVSHRQKNERLTDPREKDRAELLRNTDAVQKAIAQVFPERTKGRSWVN